MAMHSRAFLLLRRDLINLQRFPITGVTAQPTDSNDLFHWRAKIEGLAGTVWEGGVFQVSLSFNEEFNSRAPEIHFMTIPFHPNVDPRDGSPCNHLLNGGGWSEECSVSSVLLSLQAMLGSPELDGGCVCNPEAARLIKDAPHTYKQMALDCVTASLRIDAGLTPHEEEDGDNKSTIPSSSSPVGKKVVTSDERVRQNLTKPVSFDDYHTLWKGIATSLTTHTQKNQFSLSVDNDSDVSGGQEMEGRHRVKQKSLEPANLKHRHKHVSNKRLSEPVSKAQRIEDLKQMYREATATNPDASDVLVVEVKGESSGDEIDQLVQWTKELPVDEENDLLNT